MIGYTTLVVAVAIALGGWLAIVHPVSEIRGWWVTLIGTFALGSQSVAFPRQRVQLTVADSFTFYALVVHGPFAAAVVAMVGILGAAVLGERKLSRTQLVFNCAAVPLAAIAAGFAYTALQPESIVLALLAASGAFFVVNTLLICGVLTLEGRVEVRRVIGISAPGFFLSVVLTASAGSSLAFVALAGPGEWMLAGLVAVCFLVSLVLSARRVDDDSRPSLERA